MAVAADSHCTFLIPERTVLRYARQRRLYSASMNCVYYSFMRYYYIIHGEAFQELFEIFTDFRKNPFL